MAKYDTVDNFTWGKPKGISNKDRTYYSSFVYENEEFYLFDNVIVHNQEVSDGHVAKIMKLWQDISSGTMMTLLRWFLKPHELPSHLQSQASCEGSKELFLAFGKSKGVSNENRLDCIDRKCKVLCTSKDDRNIQPSESDLKDAEYFFNKIYNVDLKKLSNVEGIVRILGQNVLFNKPEWISKERLSERDNGLASVKPSPSATSHESPAIQQPVDDEQMLVPDLETRTSDPRGNQGHSTLLRRGSKADNSLLKGSSSISDTGKSVAERANFRLNVNRKTLQTLSGMQRAYHTPLERSSLTAQQRWTRSASAKKSEQEPNAKVETKLSEIRSTGRALFADPLLQPALFIPTRSRSKQMQHYDSTLLSKFQDTSLEESIYHGRVLLMQNVDPLFTSTDVHELMKIAFKGCSDAAMLRQSGSVSALAGAALLVFETDSLADSALQQLEENCLILPGCRPLIGSKVKPSDPGKITRFPGHFPLDNFKLWKQRQEEMKTSFEISHFLDPKTLEFEMAAEWRSLYEWLGGCQERLCKIQAEEERVLLEKYKKPKLCLP